MASYEENLERLNTEQRKAVEYLSGPLLVLAGPGTGKTQLLSMKVAYILKNLDISPENILCLTFTDAGKINMRDRLASIIGAIPASKVSIHTYHTLGSEILSLYKNYAEKTTRNFDNPIDVVQKYKIINKIQESLPGNDILRGDSIKDILDTISSAKSHRLSASDLERIANINIEESKIITDTISPLFEQKYTKFADKLDQIFTPIKEIFDSYDDSAKIVNFVPHTISILKSAFYPAYEEALSTGKITPLTDGWRKKFFEKTSDDSWRLSDTISNKKLLSLSHIMQEYESHLISEGLFDFDDMIGEAINILKNDEGFRLTLEERFQYVLLDEFQDTNPSQFDIVKLLTDYDNPNIMAVGDDDQAIYEFQGALVSNMGDFKHYYNSEVINLVTNYRSTQDILDFSKQIIDQVDDSFAKTEPGIEKTLTAFFKDKEGSIARHEFLTEEGEYYWVAEKISDLLNSGVKGKDIAILTAKHASVQPLLPYLHAKKNISVSYTKNENIIDDPRIHELITIARFTHSLAQGKIHSSLLPEILSFPFWDLNHFTAIEAIRLCRLNKKSALDALKNSEDETLKSLGEFLATLAIRSFDTPITTFINYLTGTTSLDGYNSHFLDYYQKNLDSFELFDLYEKLNILRNKLISSLKNPLTTPHLSDFIELLDDYELAGQGIINSSPYEESDNAIHIMSAHASKGLEFEHIFIISANGLIWGTSKGNNNKLVLPKNLTEIRHSGASDSERLRLLFVAITRARSHLYITNSKFIGDKPVPRLTYLNESEDGDQIISGFIPKDSEKPVITHYNTDENSHSATDLSITWLDTYLKETPNLLSIYKSRMENFRLSHSSLTCFIDITYAGPKVFFERNILRAPGDPADYNQTYGNLIHNTFEKITKEHITDEEAIDFFKAEAVRQEIEPSDIKMLLEKGSENLQIALTAFGDILRDNNSYAEIDLGAEHPIFDGIPLTGKIDHMKVNDDTKSIEIYDFKTHTPITGAWTNKNLSIYKYALQLCFYKLLLNLSPKYKNYTITSAHILFVTPDKKTGEVLDKVYYFDESTEELLKSLIKKVYEKVHDLSFLEDNSLMINPNSSVTFDANMEFIEKLLNS